MTADLETLAADTRYFAEAAAPSTPSSGQLVTYAATDGTFRVINDAGDEIVLGQALQSGSSFPGSPSAGDRYQRSDIDYMVFVYDGTQWVSEEVRMVHYWDRINDTSSDDKTADTMPNPFAAIDGGDCMCKLIFSGLINGTSDASNYWEFEPLEYSGGWGVLTSTVKVDTKTAPASLSPFTVESDWTAISHSESELGVRYTKVGSPGGVFGAFGMAFRLIAT